MEAVRLTPSGYNAQPWHFVVVRNAEKLAEIERIAFHQKQIRAAGTAIIVLGNTEFGTDEHARLIQEWSDFGWNKSRIKALSDALLKDRPLPQRREMALRAGAMAAMTLMLTATEMGFATCPMMGFDHKKLLACIGADTGKWVPVLLCPIGKTNQETARPPRKSAASLWSAESL